MKKFYNINGVDITQDVLKANNAVIEAINDVENTKIENAKININLEEASKFADDLQNKISEKLTIIDNIENNIKSINDKIDVATNQYNALREAKNKLINNVGIDTLVEAETDLNELKDSPKTPENQTKSNKLKSLNDILNEKTSLDSQIAAKKEEIKKLNEELDKTTAESESKLKAETDSLEKLQAEKAIADKKVLNLSDEAIKMSETVDAKTTAATEKVTKLSDLASTTTSKTLDQTANNALRDLNEAVRDDNARAKAEKDFAKTNKKLKNAQIETKRTGTNNFVKKQKAGKVIRQFNAKRVQVEIDVANIGEDFSKSKWKLAQDKVTQPQRSRTYHQGH